MKLSVITDEISMDLAHALNVMREYGVQGAELRSLWGRNLVDLSDIDVGNARTIVHDKGMVVSCIASPLFKCHLEPVTSEATGRTHQARERTLADQPALLERIADLAMKFDTNVVRIFSFWKNGELTQEIEDQIVEEMAAAAEAAERRGIILAVENEHSCYLSTGEQVARILRRVNSPSLRAVWDPGNAFCAGEKPFPNGYGAIRDFMVHIHLKDAVQMDTGECRFVAMGDGQIDYMGQLMALRADGYSGWLSLETHYAPKGGDGEAGSRRCLVTLNTALSAAGKSK